MTSSPLRHRRPLRMAFYYIWRVGSVMLKVNILLHLRCISVNSIQKGVESSSVYLVDTRNRIHVHNVYLYTVKETHFPYAYLTVTRELKIGRKKQRLAFYFLFTFYLRLCATVCVVFTVYIKFDQQTERHRFLLNFKYVQLLFCICTLHIAFTDRTTTQCIECIYGILCLSLY